MYATQIQSEREALMEKMTQLGKWLNIFARLYALECFAPLGWKCAHIILEANPVQQIHNVIQAITVGTID
jgi:hypothetical protein